jgi:hypothetical protein
MPPKGRAARHTGNPQGNAAHQSSVRAPSTVGSRGSQSSGGGGGGTPRQSKSRGSGAHSASPVAHTPPGAGKKRTRLPKLQRNALKAAASTAASSTPASASSPPLTPAAVGGAAPPTPFDSAALEVSLTASIMRKMEKKFGLSESTATATVAKGLGLAFSAATKDLGVVIKSSFGEGAYKHRFAVFTHEGCFNEFYAIYLDPAKAVQAFPGLVHRFKQYIRDPALARLAVVHIEERKHSKVVYLDNLYACEILAVLCFLTFGNGIHGRTYGDFLVAAFLPTDVLQSCDKVFLDNSRLGYTQGFFDDVNLPCCIGAKHATRDERVQFAHDVTGLRTTSLGNAAGVAEAMATFLAVGVKGRTACRVCGTFRHATPCIPIEDLGSELR